MRRRNLELNDIKQLGCKLAINHILWHLKLGLFRIFIKSGINKTNLHLIFRLLYLFCCYSNQRISSPPLFV